MAELVTRTLEVPGATLTYDVPRSVPAGGSVQTRTSIASPAPRERDLKHTHASEYTHC